MTQPLPTAVLGRTGLEVTRLGYGGAGHGRMTDDQARPVLNGVLDAGINFIDTANCYHSSEERIGRFLRKRRSEFYVATKCGCPPSTKWDEHDWSRENLFRGLNESLERLGTDYVDLMQLHNPPLEDSRREGVVESLQEMQRQGKVRWLGISATLPDLPTYVEWGVFDTFQIPYSGLLRPHEEWLTKVAEAGAGTIVRGGVAWGEAMAGSSHDDIWRDFEKAGLDELREEGDSRTAFILRFTLAHPDVHTTIVGTTNPDHLRENVTTALRGPVSAEVYTEAKRRLDTVGNTTDREFTEPR